MEKKEEIEKKQRAAETTNPECAVETKQDAFAFFVKKHLEAAQATFSLFPYAKARPADSQEERRRRLDVEYEVENRQHLIEHLESPTPSVQRILHLTASYLMNAESTSFFFYKQIQSTEQDRLARLTQKIEKDARLRQNLALLINLYPPSQLEPERTSKAVERMEDLRILMMQRMAGMNVTDEIKLVCASLNEFYTEVYHQMLQKDIKTVLSHGRHLGFSWLYSSVNVNWLTANESSLDSELAIDRELAERANYDLDIPLVRQFRDLLAKMRDNFGFLEALQLWRDDLEQGKGDKEHVMQRIAFLEPYETKFRELEKEAAVPYAHFLSLEKKSRFYRALTKWTPRQIFSNKSFIRRLEQLCNSVCGLE